MLDLAAINAFVAVGDHGGFRSAATVLGLTSSGVSKAVSRLERRLGLQLLARNTRSVKLTPSGVAFHMRCRAILAELSEAEFRAMAAARIPQGKLTVSISSTSFGRNRILPIIADYVRLHPEVDVQVRLSDRVVDLVEEGVELAVRIGHLPDSGLVASRIGQTRFVLCGSPEYLSSAGIPTHPDDLSDHRFVGFVTPGTAKRFDYQFMVDGEPRTMAFPSQLTVDNGEALIVAATHSVGLIMVVDYLVDDLLKAGRLTRILEEYEMPEIPVSIVHAPSRHPSLAARFLIEMLRQAMR